MAHDSHPPMKPVPLIIDTDAGDDIDDVLAIAFAALRPEINLLAVTTVTADSGRRAALVREVLDACGRPDIPIAAGADYPLSPLAAKGREALRSEARMSHGPAPDPARDAAFRANGGALGLLASVLEDHPEGVVLVGIGPYTNLATLLLHRPDLADRILRLSLMGGELELRRAEHNVNSDAVAARHLFASGLPAFLGTWSVTRRIRMETADCASLRAAGTRLALCLSPMVDRWLPLQTWKDCPVVYDLAPVLHAFRPDLFRTERIGVGVDCGRSLAEGWTIRDNAAPRTVDVTTDMDAEAARALLLETLGIHP